MHPECLKKPPFENEISLHYSSWEVEEWMAREMGFVQLCGRVRWVNRNTATAAGKDTAANIFDYRRY